MSESNTGRAIPPSVRGAIGGALWSLPFAIFSTWVCWRYPRDFTPTGAVLVGIAVTLIWATIAAIVAWQHARASPLTESEQVVKDEVRKAALTATILSTPVCGFFLLANWGYGPGGALLGVAMIQGMWVGSAASVGLARGKRKAREAKIEPPSIDGG